VILDSRGAEVNGNGVDITERQKAKMMLKMATLGEVNEIAHAHAVQAMNHLGNQIPALLQKMIAEAINAALTGYHQSLVERGVIPSDGASSGQQREDTGDAQPSTLGSAAKAPSDDISSAPETRENTEERGA
jgi:hypothetical protein